MYQLKASKQGLEILLILVARGEKTDGVLDDVLQPRLVGWLDLVQAVDHQQYPFTAQGCYHRRTQLVQRKRAGPLGDLRPFQRDHLVRRNQRMLEESQFMQFPGELYEQVLERHLIGKMNDPQSGLFFTQPANDFLGDRCLADATVAVEADMLAFEEVLLDGVEDGGAADEGRGWNVRGWLVFVFGVVGGFHSVSPRYKRSKEKTDMTNSGPVCQLIPSFPI